MKKKKSADIPKNVVVILLIIAVILSITATIVTLTKEKSIAVEEPRSVSKVGTVSFIINPLIRDKANVGFVVSK